jgi:hypothetical protein
MKKKGDKYGNLDGLIYPLSRCSLINLSKESCSPSIRGYNLQSRVLGAFSKRSMA